MIKAIALFLLLNVCGIVFVIVPAPTAVPTPVTTHTQAPTTHTPEPTPTQEVATWTPTPTQAPQRTSAQIVAAALKYAGEHPNEFIPVDDSLAWEYGSVPAGDVYVAPDISMQDIGHVPYERYGQRLVLDYWYIIQSHGDMLFFYRDVTHVGTVINASRLNVRSGPRIANNVIGQFVGGQQVEIVNQAGAWLQVKFGDGFGWVHSDYVEVAK